MPFETTTTEKPSFLSLIADSSTYSYQIKGSLYVKATDFIFSFFAMSTSSEGRRKERETVSEHVDICQF
jgi:hypothetical protein